MAITSVQPNWLNEAQVSRKAWLKQRDLSKRLILLSHKIIF